MKHIKKYNESSNVMTFEEFKEIMLYVLDEFDYDYSIIDCSKDDPEMKFYDCQISLPYFRIYTPFMNFEFLDESIPDFSEPDDVNISQIINSIDSNKEDLNVVKNNIDRVIQDSDNLKKLLQKIESSCIPFFKKNQDFIGSCIGFERDTNKLRITYEINN